MKALIMILLVILSVGGMFVLDKGILQVSVGVCGIFMSLFILSLLQPVPPMMIRLKE